MCNIILVESYKDCFYDLQETLNSCFPNHLIRRVESLENLIHLSHQIFPDMVVFDENVDLDFLSRMRNSHLFNKSDHKQIFIQLVSFEEVKNIKTATQNFDFYISFPADNSLVAMQFDQILRFRKQLIEQKNQQYSQIKDTLLAIHEAGNKNQNMNQFAHEIWQLIQKLSRLDGHYFGVYNLKNDSLDLVFQDNMEVEQRIQASHEPFNQILLSKTPIELKIENLLKMEQNNKLKYCDANCSFYGVPLMNNNSVLGIMAFKKNGYDFELKEMENLEIIIKSISSIIQSRLIQAELQTTLAKSLQSEKLKDNFLANISHEIRTPLNSIIGFSSMLYDEVTNTERDEYLDLIIDGGHNLMKIIDDIVDIAKIQSGEININKLDIDIVHLMKELREKFTREIQIKSLPIKLNLKTPAGMNQLILKTDPFRLTQILENLLMNAVKFTFEGEIVFGFEFEHAEMLHFFVHDTGIGIPMDKQPYVFDRFMQIETGHTREFGGNGLGLSITKSLVELLNGSIQLVSEVGKGTQFSFTLPIDYQKFTDEEKVNRSFNWIGKRFLIVDDVLENLQYLDLLLRRTGAEIMMAFNGQKAVDILDENPNIAVVIMDLQMPIMDGYQAARIIKAKNPHVKIIAQTAYTERSDKHKALLAGCDEYLEKPIFADRLLDAIANLLKC